MGYLWVNRKELLPSLLPSPPLLGHRGWHSLGVPLPKSAGDTAPTRSSWGGALKITWRGDLVLRSHCPSPSGCQPPISVSDKADNQIIYLFSRSWRKVRRGPFCVNSFHFLSLLTCHTERPEPAIKRGSGVGGERDEWLGMLGMRVVGVLTTWMLVLKSAHPTRASPHSTLQCLKLGILKFRSKDAKTLPQILRKE